MRPVIGWWLKARKAAVYPVHVTTLLRYSLFLRVRYVLLVVYVVSDLTSYRWL
jgi:hypothetical protein